MELEVVDLRKNYKNTTALNGISFCLNPGVYGLLGPNGSGKSTLINIITTNIKKTSGKVLWNGVDIERMGKRYRTLLGYVPQQQAMYPDFTVTAFLHYMASLKEISKKDVEKTIFWVLEELELSEVKNYKIKMLSGGMRQRLLIAQAIMGNPQLLIMDEPTVGLDPKQRFQIRNLIKKISKDRIVLIATHIVADLELLADEILIIKEGQLLCRGQSTELIAEIQKSKKDNEKLNLDDVYLYYFGERECLE